MVLTQRDSHPIDCTGARPRAGRARSLALLMGGLMLASLPLIGCDDSAGLETTTAAMTNGPCTVEKQSGECQPEAAWAAQAAEACEAAGLALGTYQVSAPCGDGWFKRIKYECCPDDPCTSMSLGGPTSCKSEPTWVTYATNRCEQLGLVLSSYTLGDECGPGTYVTVDFECCEAEPHEVCCKTDAGYVVVGSDDCPSSQQVSMDLCAEETCCRTAAATECPEGNICEDTAVSQGSGADIPEKIGGDDDCCWVEHWTTDDCSGQVTLTIEKECPCPVMADSEAPAAVMNVKEDTAGSQGSASPGKTEAGTSKTGGFGDGTFVGSSINQATPDGCWVIKKLDGDIVHDYSTGEPVKDWIEPCPYGNISPSDIVECEHCGGGCNEDHSNCGNDVNLECEVVVNDELPEWFEQACTEADVVSDECLEGDDCPLDEDTDEFADEGNGGMEETGTGLGGDFCVGHASTGAKVKWADCCEHNPNCSTSDNGVTE